MRLIAYLLWITTVAGGIAAILLEGSMIPWFVASVVCLALVRIEVVNEKLDRFIVIDDD